MSSYDIGVWYSPANLTDAQAGDYLSRLNSRLLVVEHRPEFDAFLRELIARFPDRAADAAPVSTDEVPRALLETWDELKVEKPHPLSAEQIAKFARSAAVFEQSPWGASLSANGDTMDLPFSWSRAEVAIPVILRIAHRHGLTTFDTESGKVTNPDRRPTESADEFLSVHLTLRLAGEPPAVDTTLLQDGRTVLHTIMPDRLAAHATARAVAIEEHDRAYEVDDPRSLAQGFRVIPMDPSGSPIPADVAAALRKQGRVTIEEFVGPDDPRAAVSTPPTAPH